MSEIVIIGDSGHSKVVAEMAVSVGLTVIAKLDDKYDSDVKIGSILNGPTRSLLALIEERPEVKVVLAIGSNAIRKKLVDSFDLSAHSYVTIIHPSAIVSPTATLGFGSVVMPGVVVNAGAVIGDHVIINSSCVVEHDCVVESYAHISPHATLTGGVQIGEGTHVGASATVIPMKSVGNWSVLGAGAVVTSAIGDHVLAVGVPAKVVKREGI